MLQRDRLPSGEEVRRIYRMLGRLWSREVDDSLLRALLSHPIRDSLVAAGLMLPASCTDVVREELAVEYCRLFVGPSGHLPLFQSVWQSGRYNGPAVRSMEQFIEMMHYEPADYAAGLMVDHLGVQLDVAGHLLSQLASSEQALETVASTREIFSCYLSSHLLWSIDLLESAAHRATSGFYRSAVQLTRNFLLSEWQVWRPFGEGHGDIGAPGRRPFGTEKSLPIADSRSGEGVRSFSC